MRHMEEAEEKVSPNQGVCGMMVIQSNGSNEDWTESDYRGAASLLLLVE